MSDEIYELVNSEKPVLDIMGNELVRGQVIAYSKAGQGERNMYVGVVTSITKGAGSNYSHCVHTVTYNGWYGSKHMVREGTNASVVILNDPIFALNSDRITRLFENIEQVRGAEHGDLIKVKRWNRIAEKEVSWCNAIPADYSFGDQIDEEQMISVPNKSALGKLKRKKVKERKHVKEAQTKSS